MIELLGSKAGVSCGRFHYGSAFGERGGHADKVETIRYYCFSHKYEVSYSIFKHFFLGFNVIVCSSMISVRPLSLISFHTVGKTCYTQVLQYDSSHISECTVYMLTFIQIQSHLGSLKWT